MLIVVFVLNDFVCLVQSFLMPIVHADYHSGLNLGVRCDLRNWIVIRTASRALTGRLGCFYWQRDRPELRDFSLHGTLNRVVDWLFVHSKLCFHSLRIFSCLVCLLNTIHYPFWSPFCGALEVKVMGERLCGFHRFVCFDIERRITRLEWGSAFLRRTNLLTAILRFEGPR